MNKSSTSTQGRFKQNTQISEDAKLEGGLCITDPKRFCADYNKESDTASQSS